MFETRILHSIDVDFDLVSDWGCHALLANVYRATMHRSRGFHLFLNSGHIKAVVRSLSYFKHTYIGKIFGWVWKKTSNWLIMHVIDKNKMFWILVIPGINFLGNVVPFDTVWPRDAVGQKFFFIKLTISIISDQYIFSKTETYLGIFSIKIFRCITLGTCKIKKGKGEVRLY